MDRGGVSSLSTIAIVDYDTGDLCSVQKALQLFDAHAEITPSIDRITSADAIVVPGQGACDSSTRHMRPAREDLVEPTYSVQLGLI